MSFFTLSLICSLLRLHSCKLIRMESIDSLKSFITYHNFLLIKIDSHMRHFYKAWSAFLDQIKELKIQTGIWSFIIVIFFHFLLYSCFKNGLNICNWFVTDRWLFVFNDWWNAAIRWPRFICRKLFGLWLIRFEYFIQLFVYNCIGVWLIKSHLNFSKNVPTNLFIVCSTKLHEANVEEAWIGASFLVASSKNQRCFLCVFELCYYDSIFLTNAWNTCNYFLFLRLTTEVCRAKTTSWLFGANIQNYASQYFVLCLPKLQFLDIFVIINLNRFLPNLRFGIVQYLAVHVGDLVGLESCNFV